MITVAIPDQGELVKVRNRLYVVSEVVPSSLPPDPLRPLERPEHLVGLTSVEDDGFGEEIQVIWELEPGAQRFERSGLPAPTSFDSPDRLDAFLDAVRWGTIASADVRRLQAPFRAGMPSSTAKRQLSCLEATFLLTAVYLRRQSRLPLIPTPMPLCCCTTPRALPGLIRSTSIATGATL
jgi:hypothetical protein